MRTPLADLQARLPELMLRDQRRLRRRIDGARKSKATDAVVAKITADIEAAEQRIQRRQLGVPTIKYPAELPVSQRKDDIAEAIAGNQVVIIAGETGSGKTTQLPKICLELGRGVRGLIGHTQPRRLAARTVADRIAEELNSPLGEAVGYQVRFTDKVGEDTYVKLMTDGILLAEIQNDRMLSKYDTLIIDEAHERSLNIDFILGYVKQLLPRRPDLKVVITSATIDPHRFSRHFSDAPIIEVSGRTYPVEVRYRPVTGEDGDQSDRDQTQAILDAVDELSAEGPGDILVFLSGEREIRDTAEALNKQNLRNTEVLPLFARLSAADQHRVFQSHRGRRVVLATNVAETSLTVPGIRYVVDPGTARISRYSHRTKVQRLPIEAISQASANQRKGRCGRVAEGICIRLYAEDDFESRPAFTDPEILRTNLASVILQMTSLGLGEMAAFPFIDPPDRRNIADGVQLLEEIGAFDPSRQLTDVGRKLAQFPVDPRLARMVLEADRNGCVREVMIIVSALSIQDPRERPADAQQAATEKHSRFVDKTSDFLALLNLWNYLQDKQKELSSNQFRKMCRAEYLNYLRVREWQDIYSQLRQVVKGFDISLNTAPVVDAKPIHQALLSGLLSHIGLKDTESSDFIGARNARFAVFPGSALFKKPPRWIMAGELVETSRLWARMVAAIDPEWIEPLAGHLIKRSYSEPHWEKTQGAVVAYEKVMLYGVPIVARRKVNYGRIDPELSRELFIRHALVEGDWETHHKFFHENRGLLDEVEDLEHRARRRDILVDDETLFDFYDQRIPSDVVSGRHFDSWWKKTRSQQPDLLSFEKSMLMNAAAADIQERDYPDTWKQDGLDLALTYQFEPGADADGVTVHVPLAVLNQVSETGFDWQIPGLRRDLVTALLRSLPKQLRRNFVPVPDYAAAVLERLKPYQEPLLDALESELSAMSRVVIPREAWDLSRVPEHLKMTFRVEDSGRIVAEDKDLDALKERLKPKLRAEISKAAHGIEKRGLRDWTFESVPKTFERTRAGHAVKAFPALADEGDSVAIQMFDTEDAQKQAMWSGTRRMLLLTVASPSKYVVGRLNNRAKLALSNNPHGSVAALLADCAACAVDALMANTGPAWDAAGFSALQEKVRAGINATTFEIVTEVEKILTISHALTPRLTQAGHPQLAPALADMRSQLDGLVYPGFITDTGKRRLSDVHRYLRAIERRLEKLPEDVARDRQRMTIVGEIEAEYRELPQSPERDAIRWMISELRVSLFAQQIGTAGPISEQRIFKAMDAITRG